MRPVLLVLLLFATSAFATEEAATDSSIRELIEITRSRETMESMQPQMLSAMLQGVTESIEFAQLTKQQNEILHDLERKIIEVIAEEMSWDRMEPEIIAIYRDIFTEKEVRDIIDFYNSDSGKSMIDKMPLMMERTLESMGRVLQESTPRIKELQERALERIISCCEKEKE